MMKTILTLVASLVILIPSKAQTLTWPMINGNAQRTSSVDMDLSFPLKVIDEFDIGYDSEQGLIVTDQYLFLMNYGDSNQIIAADRVTGDSLWQFGVTGSGGSASFIPAAADGIVLVGGQGGKGIWALDQATGNIQWFLPVGTQYTRCPIISDGKAFIVSPDSLTCADLQTGEVYWAFRQPLPQISPVCDNENVYFGAGGIVYALDKNTGEETWSKSVPNGTFSSYALDDTRLYVGNYREELNALDKANGDVLWTFLLDTSEIMNDYPGAFALTDDYLNIKIFKNGLTNNLYVTLDKQNGNEIDRFEGGGMTYGAQTIINGDLLELAYGKLTLFEIPSGNIRYSMDIPNSGESHQVIAADNKIYYAGGNGPVVRVISTDPLATRDITTQSGLQVYPNPVSERLTIEFKARETGYSNMEILSADGRMVQSQSLGEVPVELYKSEIDVSGLSPGEYFLRVNIPGGFAVRPFIKY